MTKRWRWLVAAVVLAAVLGTWSARRADACAFVLVFGSGTDVCGPLQLIEQAATVSQLVQQLTELTSINEVLSADPGGTGNMPRLRELEDENWWRIVWGKGFSTSTVNPGDTGLFNQRVPGLSDEAGWLDILASPRLGDPACTGLGLASCRQTVLLGGRPATETTAAEPSVFRTWTVPASPVWSDPGRNAGREAIDDLGDVTEGTATLRTAVWDDIEAALPAATTEADLRALNLGAEAEARLIGTWEQRERQAGAELQHTHAIAEAASTLAAQVGETAAHLGELRDDDLMREHRLGQSVLANGVTQTELLLAQAQLLAQQQAAATRERYEREKRRREEQAEWRAEMATGRADWEARRADILAQRAARIAAHSRVPDPSIW